MASLFGFCLKLIITVATVALLILTVSVIWWMMVTHGLDLFDQWTRGPAGSLMHIVNGVGGAVILLTTLIIEVLTIAVFLVFLGQVWE